MHHLKTANALGLAVAPSLLVLRRHAVIDRLRFVHA